MNRLSIRSEGNKKSTTLYLSGQLDMQTSPTLMKALQPLFASPLSSLTINMAHVDQVDSAGIATLVEGLKWGQHATHQFALQSVSHTCTALLKMYKLNDVFEVSHGG